jgi:hypothetical protein
MQMELLHFFHIFICVEELVIFYGKVYFHLLSIAKVCYSSLMFYLVQINHLTN